MIKKHNWIMDTNQNLILAQTFTHPLVMVVWAGPFGPFTCKCSYQVEAEAELQGCHGFQGWARIRSHAEKIIPVNSRKRSCDSDFPAGYDFGPRPVIRLGLDLVTSQWFLFLVN